MQWYLQKMHFMSLNNNNPFELNVIVFYLKFKQSCCNVSISDCCLKHRQFSSNYCLTLFFSSASLLSQKAFGGTTALHY